MQNNQLNSSHLRGTKVEFDANYLPILSSKSKACFKLLENPEKSLPANIKDSLTKQ